MALVHVSYSFNRRVTLMMVCDQCGKSISSKRKRHNNHDFCTRSCGMKWRHAQGDLKAKK